MRSFLALLALTVSVGSATACDQNRSHAAVLAAEPALAAPMPEASVAVTALPQSRMEEKAALAVSQPKQAGAPYDRGCLRERQTTVYLTQ